ncbi:MAG: phage holin family protein [Bacteriovoracia bacterium]
MILLSLSLVFFAVIVFFTAVLLPSFQIEHVFQLIPAIFLGGLLNFILAPLLLAMGLRLKPPSLGMIAFIFNFLFLNIATGLIDEFGVKSWECALFGSVLLSFFQLLINIRDPARKNLLT